MTMICPKPTTNSQEVIFKLLIKYYSILGKIEADYDTNIVYGKASNKVVENIVTGESASNVSGEAQSTGKFKKGERIDIYFNEEDPVEEVEPSPQNSKNYRLPNYEQEKLEEVDEMESVQEKDEEERRSEYSFVDGKKIKKSRFHKVDNQKVKKSSYSSVIKPRKNKNSYEENESVERNTKEQNYNTSINDLSTPNYNRNNKNFELLLSSNNNLNTYNNLPTQDKSPSQKHTSINPNNKNFEIYFSNDAYKNSSHNPNQIFSNNLNSSMNNFGQMQYYPPYQTMNKSYQVNNSLSYQPPMNNLNNSSLSSFSSQKMNAKIQNDPHSCNYCEDIYKFSIFNNAPLKVLKCTYCNNVVNSNSLDFYLAKYKNNLINYRKNGMKTKYEEEKIEKENEKKQKKRNKNVETVENVQTNINTNINFNTEAYAETYDNFNTAGNVNTYSSTYTPTHVKRQSKNESVDSASNNNMRVSDPNANRHNDQAGITEEWAGWVDRKKQQVKENKIYNPPQVRENTSSKKNQNANNYQKKDDEEATKPESSKNSDHNQQNEEQLENPSGPSVAEMFKRKKAELASKLENRDKTVKKEKEVEKVDATINLATLSRKKVEKKDKKAEEMNKKEDYLRRKEKQASYTKVS